MATLPESEEWVAVYQLEELDPVLGGAPNEATGAGMDNIPHLHLVKRTSWLKAQLAALASSIAGRLLPDTTGQAGKVLRVKTDETGYELRTQAQMRTDLGLGNLATKNVADGPAAIIGFVPVEQGGGTGMSTNKVRLGWRTDGAGIQAQVDATTIGVLAMKTDVLPTIAASTPGAVGTEAILYRNGAVTIGDIVPGTDLRASGFGRAGDAVAVIKNNGGTQSGSWQARGSADNASTGSATLYLRVA